MYRALATRVFAILKVPKSQCRVKNWRIYGYAHLWSRPYAKLVAGLEVGEVVVYDVESTGTDTTQDRIIQIAAMRIDKDGNEIERFERFINPGKSVGTSQLVHGFSDEYLAEHGESPGSCIRGFQEFSNNRIIVGHNVNYDISILSHELARHNLGEPQFKAIIWYTRYL